MLSKALRTTLAIGVIAAASVVTASTAYASGSQCGEQYVGNSDFSLCTYVSNQGGNGLYIAYVTNYVNTSFNGGQWTFPNGQNCLVYPQVTFWTNNGNAFHTIGGPAYACNTYKSDPSYIFHLDQEQSGSEEVCSDLDFPSYDQQAGYTNDCVGVHA